MIGRRDSHLVSGVLASVKQHQLAHQILTPAEVMERFPEFHLGEDEVAVFEEDAGYLDPERCIAAHLRMASHLGARLRFEERMLGWEQTPDGRLRVCTDRAVFVAKKLVLSVGTWAPELYGAALGLPLRVERRVLYWFEPTHQPVADPFSRTPIYIWEISDDANFYGFPLQPGAPRGVKVAGHCVDQSVASLCTPGTIDRTVKPFEVERMRLLIAPRLPQLNGPLVDAATCMYTITPNGNFFIADHPRSPAVLLVSPCSGHGFKFASVIGEVISQIAQTGRTGHDISLFSMAAHAWKPKPNDSIIPGRL